MTGDIDLYYSVFYMRSHLPRRYVVLDGEKGIGLGAVATFALEFLYILSAAEEPYDEYQINAPKSPDVTQGAELSLEIPLWRSVSKRVWHQITILRRPSVVAGETSNSEIGNLQNPVSAIREPEDVPGFDVAMATEQASNASRIYPVRLNNFSCFYPLFLGIRSPVDHCRIGRGLVSMDF